MKHYIESRHTELIHCVMVSYFVTYRFFTVQLLLWLLER